MGLQIVKKTLLAEPTWSNLMHAALAWVKASRWRKASKCKNLIMQLQAHLTIKKNRKHSIMRHSHVVIAQLLQNAYLHHALARVYYVTTFKPFLTHTATKALHISIEKTKTFLLSRARITIFPSPPSSQPKKQRSRPSGCELIEQLYKDKCLLAAYDQIGHFCECIPSNLADICKHNTVQNLPVLVTEAMASLTYAASRCGELPELHLIRNLFAEIYGRAFDNANVESYAVSFVSFELKQNLCIKVVPEYEKLNLMNEIAREHTLYPGFPESKQNSKPQPQNHYYAPEQKPEIMDVEMHHNSGDSDEGRVQPWKEDESVLAILPRYVQSKRSKGLSSDKMDYQEAILVKTSSKRITSMSIEDLDDGIKHKGAQKGLESWDGNLSSMVIPVEQYGYPSEKKTKKRNSFKMLVKDRCSVNSSIDKQIERNGKSHLSHVHPNLPDYEDVVAKLRFQGRASQPRQPISFPF